MSLKDNKIASVLVNICRRSNDIDLIVYGAWLESNGAVPLEFPNEHQEPTAGHQGPITD